MIHGDEVQEFDGVETCSGKIWRLEAALMEIKREQGKVCSGFELCKHESCASSYASWAISDAALNSGRKT